MRSFTIVTITFKSLIQLLLRLTETLNLDLERIESSAAGIFVTHQRCKQRTDKKDSRFHIPRAKNTGDIDYAGIMDAYLHEIKDCLGVFTGRVLWTGTMIFVTLLV